MSRSELPHGPAQLANDDSIHALPCYFGAYDGTIKSPLCEVCCVPKYHNALTMLRQAAHVNATSACGARARAPITEQAGNIRGNRRPGKVDPLYLQPYSKLESSVYCIHIEAMRTKATKTPTFYSTWPVHFFSKGHTLVSSMANLETPEKQKQKQHARKVAMFIIFLL